MARAEVSDKFSWFIMLGSICLVVTALYFAQEFLVPIALAVLFSFLLAPLVRRLERWKLPRSLSVLFTVAFAFAVIGIIGFVVYNQMSELSHQLPEYKQNITAKVQSFRSKGGFFAGVQKVVNDGRHMLNATTGPASPAPQSEAPATRVFVTNNAVPQSNTTGTSDSPFQMIGSVGGKILSPLGTSFIVIVFTIFMLVQREDLRDRLIRLIGRNRLTLTTQALDDAGERVSRYLLMQLIINGSVGVAVMSALWTIGKFNGVPFPSPALWGLLAALMRFIPYVGVWISAFTPVLLALAVYPSGWVSIETIAAYAGIEVICANAVEPLLFGSSTGLATLAVLVAAAFWAWLWGPVGLLLSTPLTVCLAVMGKYVPQLEFLSILLGDEPALSPHARVYQRLLSVDQEDAVEVVNEYAKTMPLEQLYDEVILPALAMCEQDVHRGNMDDEMHESILHGMRDIIDELGDQQQAAKVRIDAEKIVADAKEAANTQPPADPHEVAAIVPSGCQVNVVTLPASTEADEIAAMMFTQLLKLRGYCASSLGAAQLASEMTTAVEEGKADLICVSAVPPAAATHARYLCKRLHSKLPDLKIIAGLWTVPGDLKRAGERVSGVHAVQVSASMRTALDQVHQLAQPKLISPQPLA